MKGKKYSVLQSDGTTCPRCGELAEVREHKEITDKQLAQPFYYTRWFNCTNELCRTTIFMLDVFRVFNRNAAARAFKEKQEYREQLDFLSSI